MPCLCWPCLFYNPCQLYQWHHSACKLWRTEHKRLVLQCVSALSDKRQQQQEPEPYLPTSIRERCNRVSQSPLNTTGNNKKQTRKTAYWSTIQAVAKIWMTSHFLLRTSRQLTMMLNSSLDRDATFLLGTVSRFGRTVRCNSRIIV